MGRCNGGGGGGSFKKLYKENQIFNNLWHPPHTITPGTNTRPPHPRTSYQINPHSSKSHMKISQITREELETIKASREAAIHFFRLKGIKGWPTIQSIPSQLGQPAKLILIEKA